MSALSDALAEMDIEIQRDLTEVMPIKLIIVGPPRIEIDAVGNTQGGQLTNGDGGMTYGDILSARWQKTAHFTPEENSLIQYQSRTWIIQDVQGKDEWAQFWSIKATRA